MPDDRDVMSGYACWRPKLGFRLLRTLRSILRKVQLQCKCSVTWIEVDAERTEYSMEISIKCGEGSTLFRV